MKRFLAELQRRKVLRIASGYVVGGWIILQVALSLQTAMKLPDSFSTIIVSLLILGFPVALVASWFFEITHEGIKRTVSSGASTPIKPQTPDFILAGMLALVVVIAVVQLALPRASAPTATAEAPKPKPPALGDKSIAVLPFANLSPDKENEYFADGLTEELLNLLAKIGDLKVISRTSSFTFKGKNTPLPEIAKQLGVRHILEGTVRGDGDELRVTAQLIDVVTDTHLWSETYERKIENTFALQDEIARDIAGALKLEVALSSGPHEALTGNVEAYRLFLKARALFFRRNKGDLLESSELYKRAITLDPKFAEAHAGLATSYSSLAVRSAADFKEFAPKARQSADAGLKLKPNLARAYGVVGSLARYTLDWDDALKNSSKAVSLDPYDAVSMGGLGMALLYVGEFEQAARYLNEAKRIDPIYNLVTSPAQMILAIVQGDDQTLYAHAAKLAQSSSPSRSFGFAILSNRALAKGDHVLAEKHLRTMMAEMGRHGSVVDSAVRALRSRAAMGQAEEALKAESAKDPMFEPEAVFLTIGDDTAYYDSLNGRLARGDTVRAVFWLPYAWRRYSKDEATNAKFKDLMRNAGLVAYWRKHGWPDRCRAKGEDDFECS